MTFLMVLFILAAIVLINTPIIALLVLLGKRKTIAIVGIVSSLFIALIGLGISIFFHLLHIGFSGDPADTPLFYGLLFTAIAVAPLIIVTWSRLRKAARPGHCINCDYDLRGSQDSEYCPECGVPINQDRDNEAAAKP